MGAVLASTPFCADYGRALSRPAPHLDPDNTRVLYPSPPLVQKFVQLVPPPFEQHHSGATTGSYANNVVYNNMWVSPTGVSREILTYHEDILVAVWHADRTGAKQLQGELRHPDGLSLDMQLPQHMHPDSETHGILSLLEAGPATQDSLLMFRLGTHNFWLAIKFPRVLPFPVRHNWRTGYRVAMSFETAISQTRLNDEQRRPLSSKPTRTVYLSTTNTGVVAQRVRNLLRRSAARVVACPLHHEELAITAVDASKTEWTYIGDASAYWHLSRLPGALIFYYADGTGFVRDIESIDQAKKIIKTKTSGPDDVSVQGLVVAPAMYATVSRATPSAVTDNLEEWTITLAEFAGVTQPALRGIPALPERVEIAPHWGRRPRIGLAMAHNLISYPGGAHALHSLYYRNATSLEYAVSATAADLYQVQDIFAAAKGRYRSFWFLDLQQVFAVAREHGSSEQGLEIIDNGFDFTRTEAERIRIVMGGEELIRHVTTVTPAGQTLVLGLDKPLDIRVDQTAVAHREYRARLDIDELSITYPASGAGNTSVRVVELIQEYPQ